MLTFQALGDGNCLYNTESIWLIKSYREGNLEQLLNNQDFRQNIGRLLSHTSEGVNTIDLKATLGEPYTKASIKSALDKFIHDLSDDKEGLDWVAAQQMLAQGLRALVTDKIQNDPAILEQVKLELHDAINQCITLSTRDEVQVSFHFDGMLEIQAKVKELMQNNRLNTKQRQDALRKWFFNHNGETVGLNYYLYGENGIASPTIEAGHFEMKVLSQLLHHVIRFYDKKRNEAGHHINVIDAFKTSEEAGKHPETALVFHVEKMGNHWNALLPNDAASKEMMREYEPQRTRYIVAVQQKEARANLAQILREHGTFAAHHKKDLADFSEEEYLMMNGLTKEQYNKNILPAVEPSQPKVIKPSTVTPKKPAVQTVKKASVVGSPPSIVSKKKQSIKKKHVTTSAPADLTDDVEVTTPITETPPVVVAPPTPQSQQPKQDGAGAKPELQTADNSFLLKIMGGIAGLSALLLLASSVIPQFFTIMNPAVAGLLLVACVVAATTLFLGSMYGAENKKTSAQQTAKSFDISIEDLGCSRNFVPQLRVHKQQNAVHGTEGVVAAKKEDLLCSKPLKKYKH
ncbi:hypothetical protein CC99x_007170 [Candidatus Berkiella cookevillensis]|uniref:OTU domain-containing protein n=1 Tax=Candidatus Berkiella cookevillensis TaxID=437022 RepID=A0A0Q9YN62_9GAMM|nr:hypothetical protein [Candidatus Berkiella cookevillensis]MCS5708687.1 hypothetical protein [Candidatus Berkiella cookevillensis]